MQIEIPEATVWAAIVAGVGFWAVTAWRVAVRFTRMQDQISAHKETLKYHADLISRVEKSATDTHALVSKLSGTLEALVSDVHDIKKYIMRDK